MSPKSVASRANGPGGREAIRGRFDMAGTIKGRCGEFQISRDVLFVRGTSPRAVHHLIAQRPCTVRLCSLRVAWRIVPPPARAKALPRGRWPRRAPPQGGVIVEAG